MTRIDSMRIDPPSTATNDALFALREAGSGRRERIRVLRVFRVIRQFLLSVAVPRRCWNTSVSRKSVKKFFYAEQENHLGIPPGSFLVFTLPAVARALYFDAHPSRCEEQTLGEREDHRPANRRPCP